MAVPPRYRSSAAVPLLARPAWLRPPVLRPVRDASTWVAVSLAAVVWAAVIWCGATVSAADPGSDASIDFNRDIKPILSNQCYFCHGPDEAERHAGLRLDQLSGATEDLGGYRAIVPGDAAASSLLERVGSDDDDLRMPPPGKGSRLTDHQIELLRRWIDQGAQYAQHWSYVKPQPVAVPAVEAVAGAAWPNHPIDAFIWQRLQQQSLSPNPPADRYSQVRRLTLDLTGLPPTPDEVAAFVSDRDPHYYEKWVDQLLARPAYGEHWARMWLDLARYADSAGYADDPLRTIWLYRDQVIDAINRNQPFDQFTVEQLAGDLLPDPNDQQLIATAFHRNTMTNSEGGTDDEEFRNAAIVDRVNTTFAVWMGTTMACAQCHTHKYDPITHEDYFAAFAIFNNTADADRRDEAPLHSVAVDGQDVTVPVMQELPADQARRTHVQLRGNFMNLGQPVQPALPAAFHPLRRSTDLSTAPPPNRLDLAHWLVDPDNPLTARVIVNRYWERLFGTGLVATSEEFGSQGELPSHPELLDWLALWWIDHDWDSKALVKLLVTSATYRQSSAVTPEQWQRDPANRWLGRGPRFRMPAEAVRDQALAIAGLLSQQMHGPSVHPPQPASGLSAAFGSRIDWTTSSGADRYRRGLYTSWRRSNPYPSMSTFDAPNREVCTLRRGRSNTPLQALVTLNDPVYVEAAQGLARRILRETVELGESDALTERLRHAVMLSLARPAQTEELQRLTELYETALADLAARPDEALRLATDPLGPWQPVDPRLQSLPAAELAAWTVVANVLLNLDETFQRR